MEIKEMTISDFNLIEDKLESDFDDFWNKNILKEEILNEDKKYIIAKQDEEIVGFAGFFLILDEGEIMNIVVKKDKRCLRYRKSFIGKNN